MIKILMGTVSRVENHDKASTKALIGIYSFEKTIT